jgi:hypothetical protein
MGRQERQEREMTAGGINGRLETLSSHRYVFFVIFCYFLLLQCVFRDRLHHKSRREGWKGLKTNVWVTSNHDDTHTTTTIKTTGTGRTDGARDADASRAPDIFFLSF